MEIMLLRLFQRQVLTQCEFVIFATQDIGAALRLRDTRRIFFGLQNLLTAAANISKALWGQSGSLSEERRELRDSLGIDDDSPLKEVGMRNNFDHFDERLDRWWRESDRHNRIDMSVMSKDRVLGVDPLTWFRVFDPKSRHLFFWSEEFNVQAIVDEVERILPRLEEEANKPHWIDRRAR